MTNKKTSSLNIEVRKEQIENKKAFIINNEELGVADFGDNLEEALGNFKKSVRLYLEAYPKKKCLLLKSKTSC